MPDHIIDLSTALQWRDEGALVIDVRTPAEFAEATIPGAVNVPILDNLERAEIGTLYRQQGPSLARQRGVEMVSPRIPGLIQMVRDQRNNTERPVLVFCWRGGLRSRSMVEFLNLAGIPAVQVVGGFKAFRTHVLEFLEKGEWGRLFVLRGLTGVGKTRLLKRLEADGYPILDLEGLANHRGSAFGALGLTEQPGQKAFETALWEALRCIPPGGWALSEGESRNIGKLQLPEQVYKALQVETSLWLEAPLDLRVQMILEDYPAQDDAKEAFVRPLEALKRRLGKERVAGFLQLLEDGEWEELVRQLMVDYYDPLYKYRKPDQCLDIEFSSEDEGVSRLKVAINQLLDA